MVYALIKKNKIAFVKLQAPGSQTTVVFCVFPQSLKSYHIWSHLSHLLVKSALVLGHLYYHHYHSSQFNIFFIIVHLFSACGMLHLRKLLKVGK